MSEIESVRHWVENVVVGLNLCPFAKRELDNDRVRFSLSDAAHAHQLLSDLRTEIQLLGEDPSIETTLLIHPHVLTDFLDFNQFLDVADELLLEMKLQGIYQIASFHPNYQFAGTAAGDIENYTNRSPYPVLHLIRELSLERAINNYPDVDKIPGRNIRLLRSLGRDGLKKHLHSHSSKP